MTTNLDDALKCPLCGKLVALHHDVVTTCQFVPEPDDPLYKCVGVPFHRSCFQSWEKRQEFASRYNEAMRNHVFTDGQHYAMREDGVLVAVEVK